jgi:hypothetical protein
MARDKLFTLPKRYLTPDEVCWVYSTSRDYLESVGADELPKNRRGHRTLLYDVIDLERHFARFRMAGDEGKKRELPSALPVVVTISDPQAA